ncbi:MAG: hypothetical protein JWL77_3540 [Chthonomonadaceae bacterium]|nr:hypothetical protein [Chthonomonadaceae bacterium]
MSELVGQVLTSEDSSESAGESSASNVSRSEHPRVLRNLPGQTTLDYRIGDYATFRHALLRPLPNETRLSQWRPAPEGDLALQMVEWWAYLADILTFYNERAAEEAYLKTAKLPESVLRLTRLIGFRPRPGVASAGTVAALLTIPRPTLLPGGFQIQSKPFPGEEPQIFELAEAMELTAPDVIDADPPPDPRLLDDNGSLLLEGVSPIRPGTRVLLLPKSWDGNAEETACANVRTVTHEKDPRGRTCTRLTFVVPPSLPVAAQATAYRLLISRQVTRCWPYGGPDVITNRADEFSIRLAGITRQIAIGDPILVEIAPGALPDQTPILHIARVLRSDEILGAARLETLDMPAAAPTPAPPPVPAAGMVLPHTRLVCRTALPTTPAVGIALDWNALQSLVLIHHDWHEAGDPLPTPHASLPTPPALLVALPPAHFPVGSGRRVLLEDARGVGAPAQADVGADAPDVMRLTYGTDPVPVLTPPLRVLFNLLPVSRGKTVREEMLGVGDARQAGQSFRLQKGPLTYLSDPHASGGLRAALEIRVNGILWMPVCNLWGASADARVYALTSDEAGQTRVTFGDGVQGARLPTGAPVTAVYRVGSGAKSPPAGALATLLQPQPNLKAIRNPVPVGGGADADTPAYLRRNAPRSLLAFDRAVSADDYEALAAQAPGVRRARAYWAWDDDEQQRLVKVYVGDDPAAVDSARRVLQAVSDAIRPTPVLPAVPFALSLRLQLRVSPEYRPSDVIARVRIALLDKDFGLFSPLRMPIGYLLYRSHLLAACQSVPGIVGVERMEGKAQNHPSFLLDAATLFPGKDGYFTLADADLEVTGDAE